MKKRVYLFNDILSLEVFDMDEEKVFVRKSPPGPSEHIGEEGVFREVIGSSWLKKDIYAFRLGRGKRKILFCADGGAQSFGVTPLLTSWIGALAHADSLNTSLAGCNVRNLLNKCTVYVIPCLNPDGADIALNGIGEDNPFYSRVKSICGSEGFEGWQANGRGIDIRRNFNSKWVESKLAERRSQRLFPSSRDFGGEYPESEFETAALCLMIKRVKPDIYATVSLGEEGIKGFYSHSGMTEEKRGAEVCAAITKLTHKTAEERDFYGSPEGWFSELFSRAAFRIAIPANGSAESICTMFSAVI